MKITEAIIPVAGWGTRRLPITKAIEKCMLPIGNRPIVDYIVEDCVRAGITDIYFVINETKHSQLKDYYSEDKKMAERLTSRGKDASVLDTAPKNVNFHYVVQPDDGRYGTAVPIALAVKQHNFNEPVVMCNGDDPFWNVPSGSAVGDLIGAMQDPNESVMMGVVRSAEEISRTGAMLVVEDDMLQRLIEKPPIEQVVSNLLNINRFVLSTKFQEMTVDYVDHGDPTLNPRGEYEITDTLADYIAAGEPMRVTVAQGDWLESGTIEGWLKANDVICGDLQK